MHAHRLALCLAFAGCSFAAVPTAAAEGVPAHLWTEKSWAKPLDPDAPISMRAFSRLARELSPAVVNINVRKNAGAVPSVFGFQGSTGLGTGFIIHADGYVLTNNHVIKDTDEIQITLNNDHVYPARVIGAYAQLDVALLKFESTEKLTVAPLGDSDGLEIGEWVIAIGNPFGLNHTVTAGIVSAKGRRDIITNGEPMYARFIQTDASINPGNSGGPLINIRGEVVGINTAINAAGQGIGFAVPIDMVKKILPQLATGKVARSYLGVRVGPVERDVAERLKLTRPGGAFVREVLAGTPAATAGVLPGDVILSFGGRPVEHWEDLPWLAATAENGKALPMEVHRSGRTMRLEGTLTAFPTDTGRVASPHPGGPPSDHAAGPGEVSDIGVSVAAISPELQRRYGLSDDEGVVVTAVTPGGSAEGMGVRVGDIVTQVNYEPVRGGVARFLALVDAVRSGDILAFTIRRDNRYLFKAFTR